MGAVVAVVDADETKKIMKQKLSAAMRQEALLLEPPPAELVQTKNCSPSLMISTSFVPQNVSATFAFCCNRSCGGTVEYPSTLGRPAGFEPPACAELQQAAEEADPDAVVWKGSHEMPRAERGVKILGTPVGDPEYVKAMLSRKTEEHRVFLEHIPNVDDLQSAWLLLLFCASTRANYLIRNGQPELVVEFAQRHDARIWKRLCEITGIDEGTVPASSRPSAWEGWD